MTVAILIGILGGGFLYFRGVTLYSYRVDSPADVHYFHSPTAFGIAGLCCTVIAIALVLRIAAIKTSTLR